MVGPGVSVELENYTCLLEHVDFPNK
jgi:hypothetical protein